MVVLDGVLRHLSLVSRICEDARDGVLEGWPRLEFDLEVALGVALGFGPVEVDGDEAAAAAAAVAVVEVGPVVGSGRVIVAVEPECTQVEVEDTGTDNGIEAGAAVVVAAAEVRIVTVELAAELVDVEAEY